jgi:hypothetical protein
VFITKFVSDDLYISGDLKKKKIVVNNMIVDYGRVNNMIVDYGRVLCDF